MLAEEIIQKIKKGKKSPLVNESLELLKENTPKGRMLYPHALRTGLILKEMAAGEKTIACGLLHEIPLTEIVFKKAPLKTQEEIITILKKVDRLRALFSYEKRLKAKPLKKWQKTFLDQQAENLRRMFFAMAKDLRPVFVTLAGKLDELKSLLPYYHKDDQQRKSLAALEILAPLAYGIGMGEIKGQLEDAAFPYLYPREYNWLRESVKEEYVERKKYLEKVKVLIAKVLKKEKIPFLDIHARAKYYFSLYQKLLRYEMDLEKIYDLVALRIIVPDAATCYKVLGVIHKNWEPLPGRIKDYISSPKPNGYRSLHTTVFCSEGKPVEFQIKTPQMHKEAEYGVAAHLSYKGKVPKATYQTQFYWMEKLGEWKEQAKSRNVAQYLKSELFKDKVFVSTPKGDIIDLPRGATAVDFAYAVHSEIGDHCQGAKVNGKMVSLKQTLQTGDLVEILIDQNKGPSIDWLHFVKTNKARSKVRSFLEEKQGISFTRQDRVETLKKKVALIKKIIPRRKKEVQVLVGGISGIAVKLSKCCKPQFGDDIAAFITKGEGASVHKTDCASLQEVQKKEPQRIVQATWKKVIE